MGWGSDQATNQAHMNKCHLKKFGDPKGKLNLGYKGEERRQPSLYDST